jgi:hypothetical protein
MTYAIYEKATGVLVEGGFFTKAAALDAAATWAAETGKAYVVKKQK